MILICRGTEQPTFVAGFSVRLDTVRGEFCLVAYVDEALSQRGPIAGAVLDENRVWCAKQRVFEPWRRPAAHMRLSSAGSWVLRFHAGGSSPARAPEKRVAARFRGGFSHYPQYFSSHLCTVWRRFSGAGAATKQTLRLRPTSFPT
jgi:hypothetical protein